MDVTTLTYTGGGTRYIDLSKGLTLANYRNYDQFKNDKPQAYVVTARLSNPSASVDTIPTSWVHRNAMVKTAAAWRAMLRKAGIKKSELNTYGKELRLAFDATHSSNWCVSGQELMPDNTLDRYEAEDGVFVTAVGNAEGALGGFDGTSVLYAFDHTKMTVPSAAADTDAGVWQGHVIGTETTGIVKQYVDSRSGSVDVEDTDLEGVPEIDPDSYLRLMLSDNEESADDVMEDVKDYGDFRPYSIAGAETQITEAIPEDANVAGQDTQFIAPLGLLKWNSVNASDRLFITVQAISEM